MIIFSVTRKKPGGNKKMWNKKQSIILSKVATISFVVVILLIFIFAPANVNTLINGSQSAVRGSEAYLLMTTYSGGVIVLILFYYLYALLNQIGKGNVFEAKNIAYLRRISWLCYLGGAIALISASYWIVWIPIAFISCFIGLIVRVIKNILDEALTIKEENDFTV